MTIKIRSEQFANKGSTIVLDDDNKLYKVLFCRKLIPFLGEPKGYILELKEIINVK